MVTKSELKYIQSLSDKKVRLETGCFIAEGVKLVGEMIAAGYPLKAVYALDSWESPDATLEVTRIEAFELEKMSMLQTPNQVLAVAMMPQQIKALDLTGQLTLVLDGIQDPGNMGTIIRTADWFGIQVIICSFDTVDCYNQKVLQATMGSWNRVQIEYHSLKDILPQLNKPIYGALLNGTPLQKTTLNHEGILVVGNEGQGISNAVEAIVTNPISINGFGGAESLNVAVATGILLHELTKVS